MMGEEVAEEEKEVTEADEMEEMEVGVATG